MVNRFSYDSAGLADPLGSFERARGVVNDIAQGQARRRAGNRIAGQDYTGGASELYRAGMLDEGSGVQNYGQAQDDRAEADVKEAEAKAAKVKADQLKYTVDALSMVRRAAADASAKGGPEAVAATVKDAMTTLQPVFKLMEGYSEEQFNQVSSLATQKPEILDAMLGKAKEELEQYTLTPGSARYDETGKKIAEQPLGPKYERVGPGEQLLEIGPGGPAPAPAGQPPAGGDGAMPRNLRNNNPGNIRDGDFAKSIPGYVGSDGAFAIFENPQAGEAAQAKLLRSYGARGFNTVSKIIGRWAPPSDNNPTDAYVNFVAKKLGVDPNAPLRMDNPQVVSALSRAIAEFEGGGSSGSNRPPQLASTEGRPQIGGARVIAQGAPKPGWRPSTPEEKAAAGIDPRAPAQTGPDGKIEPIGPQRKPMTAALQAQQQEMIDAINVAEGLGANLGRFRKQVETGALNLGPVANFGSEALNTVGMSTQNSRNYASFKANLEKLRNDSLRLNKGVQTEGDAQRAWNELIANISDEGVVKQRLAEIMDINKRGAVLQREKLGLLREDSGLPPLDFNRFGGGKRAPSGAAKPMDPDTAKNAKAAIAAGKSREAVIQKLRANGFDPAGL